MADGTRLAVDVSLPPTGARVPAVLRLTRYWRGTDYLDEAAAAADPQRGLVEVYNQQGFAVVAVDARGSGASFGSNPGPWSDTEIDDYRQVIDWVVAQPWSDGHVAAVGVSYEGNTALLTASLGHPAVRAVAPLFYDFDPYLGIAFPGGAFNEGFIGAWSTWTNALDRNDRCRLAELTGQTCEAYKATIRGPRPVDPALLDAALAEHGANVDLAPALAATEFRDDEFGPRMSLDAVAPYRRAQAITAGGVPMFVRASWLDAGSAAGALAAYATLGNPQMLVIGAWSHGGAFDADPLAAVDAPADPSIVAQYTEVIEFLHRHLRGDAPGQRGIRYATLGERVWRTTPSWPPPGGTTRTWFLDASRRLVDAAPAKGTDLHTVDPTATTGPRNRWLTPLDGGDVVYGDRAAPDAKLAIYETAPLAAALRVTGDPIAELALSVDVDDATVQVYLEDVAPDGVVSYVTEGTLRVRYRAPGATPYTSPPPAHSFRRADATGVVPGERMQVAVTLLPTSALFRAGHRIRIAIGGADAGTFAQRSTTPPKLTIHRGTSRVVLPIAP